MHCVCVCSEEFLQVGERNSRLVWWDEENYKEWERERERDKNEEENRIASDEI